MHEPDGIENLINLIANVLLWGIIIWVILLIF